jgi:RNA polymerase sigma factor (sigma-70 family)
MDDLEFLRRCARADKRAWEEFFQRYSRLIYNYIQQILNTNNYNFASTHIQDIFQELFCAFAKDDYKKLKSFKAKNGCSLASWLRQVTVNFTIDYLRKIHPAASLDAQDEDGVSLKEVISDGSFSALDQLGEKERFVALEECIDNLDNEAKYFLELHLWQGARLEDLRGVFKLSRGAIDMHKFRIMEKLRDCFASKGFALDL